MFRNRSSKEQTSQPTLPATPLGAKSTIVWVGSHATPIYLPAK